ncbi:hypothetical protein VP01_719g6, partial [Puccinia sorghi]
EELITNHRYLIANTGALVHCTNVYKLYSEISRNFFPHIKILPNHHFALHIPDLLGTTRRMVMKKFCQLHRMIAEQGLKAANPQGESKSGTHKQKGCNGFGISRADYDKDGKNVSRKSPNNIVEYTLEGKKIYGEVVNIMKMGSGWDGMIFKLVWYNQVQCPAGVKNVMAKLGVVQVTQGLLVFITEKDIVWPVAF